MLQRLSTLLFGEVEDASTDISGPKPCVMDADEEGWLLVNLPEGATAESSPIEDLLIEHPSMSVYVALGNQSVQDSVASLTGSVSRVAEAVPPASQDSAPRRIPRGAAAKAGAMVKVTQVTRVQRAKARAERRHLARNRVQRQNRVREQASRRPAHTHGTYLRQPCQRTLNH
ncbi:tumor protein p53-inducible nuclear protein 2 isoform X3 [Brienomyrus brachyistius]|uniref:tumor protein p53-inducible nuclear protein 2 isoform X3 n=1 Tax=Brienomyrus brachyistius TaxID=42636 RepID=UPI0020B310D6|nr:tumor protein p53-inducible nuclear protein 2 isoform X3 [Brienomyrus brachyistius]